MSTVFAKLNFKDHKRIVVLHSPSSFESELAALEGVEIIRDLKKAKEVTFSLAFVTAFSGFSMFSIVTRFRVPQRVVCEHGK